MVEANMWRRQYLPLRIAKTGDYRKVSVHARALLYIRKIDFIVPRKYVFTHCSRRGEVHYTTVYYTQCYPPPRLSTLQ